MKVSVCVPAYERPGTLRELIRSFEAQGHPDRELCIADDSRSTSVAEVVSSIGSPRIRYQRNATNLGFDANLATAMRMATGDVLVILGDDDLLASRSALARYAAAFVASPDAAVAYANLVQIDASSKVTLLYPLFGHDKVCPAGADAVGELLLHSILITGLAFRRTAGLTAWYPTERMLFPQVKLSAELLRRHPGIGISDYLCATRATEEQLGFKANEGPVQPDGPQHGNIEVLRIIRDLEAADPGLHGAAARMESQLSRAYATNMINERIINGRRVVQRNLWALASRSRVARRSPLLWAACVASSLLPSAAALFLKERLRGVVFRRQLTRQRITPAGLLETLHPAIGGARP